MVSNVAILYNSEKTLSKVKTDGAYLSKVHFIIRGIEKTSFLSAFYLQPSDMLVLSTHYNSRKEGTDNTAPLNPSVSKGIKAIYMVCLPASCSTGCSSVSSGKRDTKNKVSLQWKICPVFSPKTEKDIAKEQRDQNPMF